MSEDRPATHPQRHGSGASHPSSAGRAGSVPEARRPWSDHIYRALDLPAAHPWITLLVTALCLALSFIGLRQTHFEASLEGMLAETDAARALVRVFNDFSAADDLLVLASLPGNPSNRSSEADPNRLQGFARRLEDAVNTSPASRNLVQRIIWRVDPQSIDFVKNVIVPAGPYYLDDPAFTAFQQRLTPDGIRQQIQRSESLLSSPGPAAAALSKIVQQDPLRLHEFILSRLAAQQPFQTYQNSEAFLSPDGRHLLIRIVGQKPPSDLGFSRQLTATIASLTAQVNADRLTIELAGAYAISAASEHSIRQDMISSVTGSVILMQILFLLAYRNFFRFILAFIPVAVGIVLGFGLRSAISSTLTPLTAVIGGVLAGMGIDYTIQFLSQYERERSAGRSADQAIHHTLRSVAAPVLAAWATTIIGFLAVGASSVPALRDFAIVGSLGLGGAFLASLIILPALLRLTDRSPLIQRHTRLRFSLEPLVRWTDRHARICIAACAALLSAAAIVALIAGPRLFHFESDLTVMHPRPNAPLDAQADIAQRFNNPEPLIVLLRSDSPDGLVRLACDVQQRLAAQPARQAGVARTVGLSTFLPDPRIILERSRQLMAMDADRVLADFRSAIADSAFDVEAYAPSATQPSTRPRVSYGTLLRRLLTAEAPPTLGTFLSYPRLAELFLPKSSVEANSPPTEALTLVFLDHPIVTREQRNQAVLTLRQSLAGLPGATLTGMGIISFDTEDAIHRDLPKFLIVATGLVTLYLLFHFRNLRDAILAMLPTLLSLLCLLAAMHLLDRHLNMINLIGMPLLIGIDVDYGIFLVSVARASRTSRASLGDSRATFVQRLSASSHAILICAASTLLGFGSLIWTSVPAIRSLGWVVAIGITTCALATFFLLTPLLLRRHEHHP